MLVVLKETYCNKVNIQIQRDDFILITCIKFMTVLITRRDAACF